MRTWTINLLVSFIALVMTPVVFIALHGGFIGSPDRFSGSHRQPYTDPFAGIPQGYRPQFGFPPVRRPVMTEEMQRQRCVAALSTNANIESAYREPYCGCLAQRSYFTSGAAGAGIIATCRATTLNILAARPDVDAVFDARFSRICDRRFVDRDERLDAPKTQEVCGCMASSIRKMPVRAASIGFAGGESDGNRALNGDLEACFLQTKAFMGEGWKIEHRDGGDVAVLGTPGHHDIAALTLSCTPDKAMRLEAAFRPGHHADRIWRDPSSYTNGWQIRLKNGVAVGKEVTDFFQLAADDQEKSGGGANGTSGFIEMMPDGRSGENEALFGDFKREVAPVLKACAPKPGGDFTPPPVTAAAALPGASPDKWTYAGRTAQFGLDAPADGVAPLTLLRFSCEGEPPYLELAGGFTDDAKTRDRLKIQLGPDASMTLKMACDYAEGGISCMTAVKGEQLKALAAAPVVGLSVGGKVLATVPFGSSEGVRKTFPYCKLKKGPANSDAAPSPVAAPATPPATIDVGHAYTLASSLNLRAAAANDGRIVRSLPAGTTLVVTRKVSSKGDAWSGVSLFGSEVGFVKDSALLKHLAANGAMQAIAKPDQATGAGANCTARVGKSRERFLEAVRESKIPSLVDPIICAHGKSVRKTALAFSATLKACPQADGDGAKRRAIRKIFEAAGMLTKSCR